MKTALKTGDQGGFEITSGSGHTVTVDVDPNYGGNNRGPRPMELLLMGLAGCTAFDVNHILKRQRQDVEDCQVKINAERAETDPKVFTHIHVHFVVSGRGLNSAKVERAIHLSAEKYCSASIMMSKTAEISHTFELVDNG